MKKNYLSIVFFLLLCIVNLTAQTEPLFEWTMYFEDAVGNQDSIVVGYDPSATYQIDEAFGEEDITNTPFNTNFEVRAANIAVDNLEHSKRQITGWNCPNQGFTIIGIVVRIKEFPLKISWDKNLFIPFGMEEDCRDESFITKDVASFHLAPNTILKNKLKNSDFVSYTKTYTDFHFRNIEDGTTDTIYEYMLMIADNDFNVGINDIYQNLEINYYPNPTTDQLLIETSNLEVEFKTLKVTNIMGQVVHQETIAAQSDVLLDVEYLLKGMYLLQLYDEDGRVATRKFIKE